MSALAAESGYACPLDPQQLVATTTGHDAAGRALYKREDHTRPRDSVRNTALEITFSSARVVSCGKSHFRACQGQNAERDTFAQHRQDTSVITQSLRVDQCIFQVSLLRAFKPRQRAKKPQVAKGTRRAYTRSQSA